MPQPFRSQGFFIAGSSHTPNPSKLPAPTKQCRVIWLSLLNRSYKCGHRNSRRFRVSAFGRETKNISQIERCPTCFLEWIKQHTIFCALCGLPIMSGDPVVLYDDMVGVREEATRFGNSVFCCTRNNCSPAAVDIPSGHWSTEGFKPLIIG